MKLLSNLTQHLETIPDELKEYLQKEKFSDFVIEVFKGHFPETLKIFQYAFKQRDRNLIQSVNLQHKKKGKLKVVEKEIKKIQHVLDNDMVKEAILPMFDKTFYSIIDEIKAEYELMKLLGFDNDELMQFFESFFKKLEKVYISDFSKDEGNTILLSEFENFWAQMPTQNIPKIYTTRTVNEKNTDFFVLRCLYTMLLFFHLERTYLKDLTNYYYSIKNERNTLTKTVEETSNEPKKLPLKNNPLPEGWTKIQLTISEEQEREFLSFFIREKNGTNSGFLSENDFSELSTYGLSIPPSPTGKYYKLNLEGKKKTKSMIYYAFYRLNGKTSNTNEKTNLAKYLKYFFEDFKDLELEAIKNNIRGRKSNAMFDIDAYFN